MRLLFLLGTNPELSKSEIEAASQSLPFLSTTTMLHAGMVELVSNEELAWEKDGVPAFLKEKELLGAIATLQNRLGGTMKIALLVKDPDMRSLPAVLIELTAQVAGEAARATVGVSMYGRGPRPSELGMLLKHRLRDKGVSLRYVPVKEHTSLSTAQTWHNKLDLARYDPLKPAMEALVVEERGRMLCGVVLTVQNPDEYARRDFGIPAPDAVSGMLPPKLAQIMINLALGAANPKDVTIYDPFCGNGRILLEGWTMGAQVAGSDLEAAKVDATRHNLEWLGGTGEVWQANATLATAIDEATRRLSKQPFYLVAEPYLGKPLRKALTEMEAKAWLADLERIYLPFFENWAKAARKPERLLVVFPAAQVQYAQPTALFAYLFDRLEKMGYRTERLSRYARPDAVVARDIVLLTYR